MRVVDLRSDTVTRPTPAMRQAIAEASVGDDVFGDDPTVNRLQDMAAERLDKDFALYVPSGTMANQIAIRLHTHPGDEVVMEGGAHPFNYEAGGHAMISGVSVRPISGDRGILATEDVAATFRPVDPHFSPVGLVCVEDTSNGGGGSVYPLERLDAIAGLAHEKGAQAHLDGARLFNAAMASGVPAARRARSFDTVSVCLSKGLGAPVGSLLCGPERLRERAWRIRKALGGGMRQAGIIAAAGIHALTHHVDRLVDDHRRCGVLAEGLRGLGFTVTSPETNMVYVSLADGPGMVEALVDHGVLCASTGPRMIRLVTHLDVDDGGIAHALSVFDALAGHKATGIASAG